MPTLTRRSETAGAGPEHQFTLDELTLLLPMLRRQYERETRTGELAHLEARVLADIEKPPPVCPACGYRPARHKATGWCLVCFIRQLTQEANLAALEAEERRELEAAKKRRTRARHDRCDHCIVSTDPQSCPHRKQCNDEGPKSWTRAVG